MRYFKNKFYLTKDSERVAHVHIINGNYIVCGHYRKFTEFKRRVFDKTGFDEFVRKNDLVLEQ